MTKEKIITLEKLAAVEEAARKLEEKTPVSEDGPVCSGCFSMVDVRNGCEWTDGDRCDECIREWYDSASPTTVLSMVDTIRKLTEVAKFYGKSENYIFHNPQQVEFVQTGVKIITAQGGVLDDQGKRARALLEEIGVKG